MKRVLLVVLAGLAFGFISGCIGMAIAHEETLPDPTQDHWYDIASLFSVPGVGLTWAFFNPPDGYYGDIWDNRIQIVFLNSVSWVLIFIFFASLISLGRAALTDLKSFRRKLHAR